MTNIDLNDRPAFYDDEGFNYMDFWSGRAYEHESEVIAIRRLLSGRTFEHAADIGGGYGRLSVVLSEFAAKVTLVDSSSQQLALAADFLARHPGIAGDLNAAQKGAVDLWYGKPERAMEIVGEVTKLPRDVIQVAYRETVRMLSGLPDEQVDTLVAQLKINKEFGFLKSDIWDSPERIRREFFYRG